ncbi:MAG TPA: glycosyltransferase family 39 protein [Bryobacteraceae bacterium]|nr:glycosyltransferase family 39 protein [Bryobacteraceae bacterium]
MNNHTPMSDPPRSPRTRAKAIAPWVAVVVLLFVAAVVFQAAGGAFNRELAGYPDEAAHYVTALMLRDYAGAALGQSPMEFALNYYLHYPKVAFGHWPPMFYVVQAGWMLVFSSSKTSVLVLMAVLAACVAAVVCLRVSRRFGLITGIIVASVYLALPVVQEHTAMVMAEGLLTLFCFLAAISFGVYLDSEKWQDCAWFGVFTSLAILTKGNAWALFLIPPVALLVAGRWRVLRQRAIWLTGAGVLAVCLPWQLLTLHMASQGWNAKPGFQYTVTAVPAFVAQYADMTGVVVLILALVGMAVTLLLPRRRAEAVAGEWAAMFGLVTAMLLFHSLVPAGVETRKLMPAAPAVLLFAIQGAVSLFGRFGLRWRTPVFAAAAVALIFGLEAFTIPVKPQRDLSAAAERIATWPRGSVTLVSSDANGEGAFISEVAMRDERPNHIVLRASKLLGDESWGGDHYQSRFSDVVSVQRLLDQIPVESVVIDNWPGMRARPHHELLLRAITENPSEWVRVAVQGKAGTVTLYRRASPIRVPAGAIRLTAESMLSRSLGGAGSE